MTIMRTRVSRGMYEVLVLIVYAICEDSIKREHRHSLDRAITARTHIHFYTITPLNTSA